MAYKHGVYGEQQKYTGKLKEKSRGTVVAYIGTAPVQQCNTTGSSTFDYTEKINKPILLTSYKEALAKIGYSSDWESYTLCEAVKAHFMNNDGAIAPIIVVNMADATELANTATTATVTVAGKSGKKVGYLADPLAAIENITVTTQTLNAGDYKMEYDGDAVKITVTSATFNGASITVSYKQIDVSNTAITVDSFKDALNSLDYVEQLTNIIPNIIAAPKYSAIPAYHEKLIDKVEDKIMQKWYTVAVCDIPADSTTNTLALAKTWKEDNYYNSVNEKVFFPCVKYNDEVYHLSTMAAALMQYTDTNADNVPYISASNKPLFADAVCLADGTELMLTETEANSVNEVGIATINYVHGGLRLWGNAMANYSYANEAKIDPDKRQDVAVRMVKYLMNKLQYDYLVNVDMPASRRDIDAIVVSVQQWLNSLINEGKMLYATVAFDVSDDAQAEFVNGDFTFNVQYTNAPNAKSLTFKVQYTTDGLAVLLGGEE